MVMEMVMVRQATPAFYTPSDYKVDDAKKLGNFEWRKPFAEEYIETGFPKWKRLNLSQILLGKLKPYTGKFLSGNAQVLKTLDRAIEENLVKEFSNVEFRGAHPKFTLMSQAFFNAGFFSEIKGHGNVYAHYDLNANSTTIENSVVIIRSGSKAIVIREITGKGKLRVSATKFLVEKGSKLKFFNILIAPNTSLSVDSNLYIVKEGADVEVYDIILGSEKVASNHEFRLVEPEAKVKLTSAYFELAQERADLEYKLIHNAPKTFGRLKGNGVVGDEAYMVFRGNIDIPHESYGVDSEEEGYTLNLSPKARVDAIPSLNVRNNTVNARHAASIGKLDEQKLYYMMSRGLDKQMVMRLIIEGMFRPIIDAIPMKLVKRDVENGLFSRI